MAEPVVNHVGLCVSDVERSARFYQDILGFRWERALDVPDEATSELLAVDKPVGLRAVYLRLGSFTLELLRFDRPGNPPAARRVFNEPGLTHLSFCVEDPASIVARVEQAGGSVSTSLLPMAAMVRDPDGQLLEILPMSYRDSLPAEAASGPRLAGPPATRP
jgi:catechol 2,3-dioxygenase-like lactoylglutathione lyase family enzyme